MLSQWPKHIIAHLATESNITTVLELRTDQSHHAIGQETIECVSTKHPHTVTKLLKKFGLKDMAEPSRHTERRKYGPAMIDPTTG